MTDNLNIILLGAPGSGKGTQSKYLCETYNLAHISTGNLFRLNMKNNTELGKLAKTYIDKGDLVPDDVTINMVREQLAMLENGMGTLFDGFPRNTAQADALTPLLDDMSRSLNGTIHFKVDDEVIVGRLSGRLVCKECEVPFHTTFNPFQTCPANKCSNGEYLYQREDDQPETVRARLRVYHKQTEPLIEYYSNKDLLTEIDGTGGLDVIQSRLVGAVDNLK